MDYRKGSEQYVWLQKDLAASQDARWRFVFFHHPPYCSNNCQIEGTRVLCPLFESAAVDVVYSAHSTHYERFYPIRSGHIDQEGVVYVLTGGGGCDPEAEYAQLWDHVHPMSAMAKGAVNFFVLTHVSPTETTIRAISSEGHVFDSLTLRKGEGPVLPLRPPSPQLPFPRPPKAGTIIAGFAEHPSRWVLLRPDFAVDNVVSRSGNQSIRWHKDDGGITCPSARRLLVDDGKAVEAAGGKAYVLSAWIRTEEVAGAINVSLGWSGDMGFLDRIVSTPVTGTHPWTEVRVRTPALPQHVYAVRVLLSAEAGSSGTAWFDDLRIVEALSAEDAR